MSNLLANYRLPSSIPTLIDVNAGKPRPRHATSSLADLCRLLQIPSARAAANTSFSFKHVQLTAKQVIYSVGQPFDALYIVNSGFVKTTLPDDLGQEQVLGFPMKGDLLGIDGIHQQKYASNAVALSHCNLVMVPFEVLRSLNREYPEIELAIYRIMSQKLMQDRSLLNIMGSRISEVRVAHFLTYMSERFSSLGYSDKEFKLPMSRQETASYLGLSLETVSRIFSAFHQLDFIAVSGRSITLKQPQKLKTLRRLPQLREKTKVRLLKQDRMPFNAVGQLGI
ncbi:MAG: Crp/Fnr family transcriptional regulator [Burkholderiaceae bacterium]